MDQGMLQGIGTILAMLAFGGICWWAYISKSKKDFDDVANAPFNGDELAEQNERNKEQNRQDKL